MRDSVDACQRSFCSRTRKTLKVYPSWLDSATTSTAGPSGPVVRDWCNVFYSSNSKTVTGKHSDSGLSSRTRGPSTMSTGSSYSNMKRGNSLVFRGLGGSGSSLHRCIGCSLESVRLDVLSPSASRDRLRACEVCYVDHRVVEG